MLEKVARLASLQSFINCWCIFASCYFNDSYHFQGVSIIIGLNAEIQWNIILWIPVPGRCEHNFPAHFKYIVKIPV